jgi:uncharacterized iron-regulated membrane protein
MGGEGMTANAIGGFLIAALCLSGIIVWWPGIGRWRRAVTIRAGVDWKRLVFDLHRALGFWIFGVLLMWGLTGGYFVFPQPFRAAVNFFAPINAPTVNPPAVGSAKITPAPQPRPRRRRLTLGGRILRGFSIAHYGLFGGWEIKVLWVILGLAPAVLFCTAVLMWWTRVLAPAIRRFRTGNII